MPGDKYYLLFFVLFAIESYMIDRKLHDANVVAVGNVGDSSKKPQTRHNVDCFGSLGVKICIRQ